MEGMEMEIEGPQHQVYLEPQILNPKKNLSEEKN
jgi:hypothetical protein